MEPQQKVSKQPGKRLSLSRETLRRLDENTELDGVSGGTSSLSVPCSSTIYQTEAAE